MAIVGIGIDLVEIERIDHRLSEERFVQRLFSPAEIGYCQAQRRPAQHFAARLAAKEAVMKALGTGWSQGIGWREIEVCGGSGPPAIALAGRARERADCLGATTIHLSLTHTDRTAAAVAVLESAPPGGAASERAGGRSEGGGRD